MKKRLILFIPILTVLSFGVCHAENNQVLCEENDMIRVYTVIYQSPEYMTSYLKDNPDQQRSNPRNMTNCYDQMKTLICNPNSEYKQALKIIADKENLNMEDYDAYNPSSEKNHCNYIFVMPKELRIDNTLPHPEDVNTCMEARLYEKSYSTNKDNIAISEKTKEYAKITV